MITKFQSTLPMRGETEYKGNGFTRFVTFQSTLPMRGETYLRHLGETT